MGRIKGTLVKRTTKDLITKHPTRFSDNFEENKKGVSGSVLGVPKKLRNSIAGYITRLQGRAKKQKK